MRPNTKKEKRGDKMPNIKVKPTLTWDEAPDTITPVELAQILGVGTPNARQKFDEKGFPRIQGLGKIRKADKNAARLYIQGINIKENQKEAINSMLLFELKKLNNNFNEMRLRND